MKKKPDSEKYVKRNYWLKPKIAEAVTKEKQKRNAKNKGYVTESFIVNEALEKHL